MPLRLSKNQKGRQINQVILSARVILVFIALLLFGLHSTPLFASASFTSLDSNWSNATTTTFTTASVTPTANNPVFFATVAHLASGNGPQPVSSVSGAGLTWATVASLDYGQTAGSGKANHIEIWCGVAASPSTGVLTLTWTTSPALVTWSVSQSSGLPQTCAAAFNANKVTGSSDTGAASPLTATMGAFAGSSSGVFAVGAVDNASSIGPGTSMTEISSFPGHAEMLETEFAAGNVSPVTATYGGVTVKWGIIALEILPQTVSGHRPLSF